MSERHILYARKSTDVEDKQVLSIEAQLTELRAYAKQENLEIIDELIEKQSAKIPGRPILGQLLKRIEAGEATGILAWHPDRLARNSIDGGQIIYLLDCGQLNTLKFPTFWFENTSQGKFMLSIAFGQSKYYVDSLSENTKRGLRQKVRRGEYPGVAPIGYMNDVRNKTIIVNEQCAPLIHQACQLYASGQSRLEDISLFLAEHGIKTSGGKPLSRDRVKRILTNPFYYGHFKYGSEVYEGKHTPIITKRLFDEVEAVLSQRGRPRKQLRIQPKAYCGLLACSECHMGITAEVQKGHVYYRCTRKHKIITCHQVFIREEELDKQISELLRGYALSDDWAQDLQTMLNNDEKNEQSSSGVFVASNKAKIQSLQSKLQRLLDGYLDQDIDRETYLSKKAELLGQKKSLEEKTAKRTRDGLAWVEPMRKWIIQANSIRKTTRSTDLQAKKTLAKEIFGSNLILQNKKTQLQPPESASFPLTNNWTALHATLKNPNKKPISFLLVREAGIEPAQPITANRF